jgi:crotonobetainyl-CoA:carnitine CoA-transferase CaiB-like acyl-CoA transferase
VTLIPRIAAVIRQRQSSEWITLLEQANVPCGPINTIDQVFDDPQSRRAAWPCRIRAGTLPSIAYPVRFAGAPIAYKHAPPPLGEHTDEVLEQVLGIAIEARAALRKRGVI